MGFSDPCYMNNLTSTPTFGEGGERFYEPENQEICYKNAFYI